MPKPKKDDVEMDLMPMIDVIFLLLIFFLVGAKFKKPEVQMDAFLPPDMGQNDSRPVDPIELEDHRIFVLERNDQIIMRFDGVLLGTFPTKIAELARKDWTEHNDIINGFLVSTNGPFAELRKELTNLVAREGSAAKVVVSIDPKVPYLFASRSIDLLKACQVQNILFQASKKRYKFTDAYTNS